MTTIRRTTFLSLILAFSNPAQADTLSVGGAGDYAKIQDAINAAKDGDTIALSEGEYEEDLVVSGKKELVITSSIAPTDSVILRGKIEIKLDAHDIELQDFTIDASGKSFGVKIVGKTLMNGMVISGGNVGVQVGDLTKIDKMSKISTSTIQGSRDAAVDCKRNCWIEIAQSTLQNVTSGVGVRARNGKGRVKLADSFIKNNKIGVAFTDHTSKKNQIWRTTFEGNVTGILLIRSEASLKNLTFSKNKKKVIRVR